MGRFRAFWGTTEISDHVIECSTIPLVKRTHDGEFVLPGTSIDVIWGANDYQKGDVISFQLDNVRCASFVIDEVERDFDSQLITLTLVDQLKALEGYYVKDLTATDYGNAMTAAQDYDESVNLRYYYSGASSTPHRVNFVTLTHMIKTCLVKAGLAPHNKIDMTAFYGEIDSGFRYYSNSGTPGPRTVCFEELAFQANQVHWSGYNLSSDPAYNGTNLLQMVQYCLWILNAELRYVDTEIVISPRAEGAYSADDDVYSYDKRDWLNSFDIVAMGISYVQTLGVVAGFTPYTTGSLGPMVTESYTEPDAPATDRKLSTKSYTLIRHAVVHRRDLNDDHYEIREFETMAWGETFQADYRYASQFCAIIQARFPGSGVVERYEVPVDPGLIGARRLLSHELDVARYTSKVEF